MLKKREDVCLQNVNEILSSIKYAAQAGAEMGHCRGDSKSVMEITLASRR